MMKRAVILSVMLFLACICANGQKLKPNPRAFYQERKPFWGIPALGLFQMDSTGTEVARTDAIFSRILPYRDDEVVVRIPISAVDKETGKSYDASNIVAVLGPSMEVKFVFPLGTMDVGMMYCGDGYVYLPSPLTMTSGMPYTRGVVNKHGKVVFETAKRSLLASLMGKFIISGNRCETYNHFQVRDLEGNDILEFSLGWIDGLRDWVFSRGLTWNLGMRSPMDEDDGIHSLLMCTEDLDWASGPADLDKMITYLKEMDLGDVARKQADGDIKTLNRVRRKLSRITD